jgi:hypothetical protein
MDGSEAVEKSFSSGGKQVAGLRGRSSNPAPTALYTGANSFALSMHAFTGESLSRFSHRKRIELYRLTHVAMSRSAFTQPLLRLSLRPRKEGRIRDFAQLSGS